MGLLSFKAKPIDPNEKKKSNPNKGVKLNVKSNKTGAARKRDLTDYVAYGDTLFEKAWKPAKEVVVCFLPFTSNNYRISKDGKYAIEYNLVAGQYHSYLFKFKDPIEYEYKFEDFNVDDFENASYGPFLNLEDLKKRLVQLVKDEHLAIRALEKDEALKKKLEEEQLKEKANSDAEKLTEQLAAANIGKDPISSERETQTEIKNSEKKEEIQVEVDKEETSNIEKTEQSGE